MDRKKSIQESIFCGAIFRYRYRLIRYGPSALSLEQRNEHEKPAAYILSVQPGIAHSRTVIQAANHELPIIGIDQPLAFT